VHLFRPSLSFLAEAQPRLETGGDKRHFLGEVHTEVKYKAKDIIGKNLQTNLLPFSNRYIY
jgi:hypothetical protein